jgi:hypothetical protein
MDIATLAEIGTATGTLFLGAATFASVRSANRAARVAERSLLLGLRPVLVTARYEDPDAKVLFGDGRKFRVPAGTGLFELIDESVYLAIPLRNVGTGLAVLQGYDVIVLRRARRHRVLARRLPRRRREPERRTRTGARQTGIDLDRSPLRRPRGRPARG